MNASKDYQLAQSITAGSDKLIPMKDGSPRHGNANVRLCYDIAQQESRICRSNAIIIKHWISS